MATVGFTSEALNAIVREAVAVITSALHCWCGMPGLPTMQANLGVFALEGSRVFWGRAAHKILDFEGRFGRASEPQGRLSQAVDGMCLMEL